MPITDKPSSITENMSAGEYGATRVAVSRDGSAFRIAFGRSGAGSNAVYYSAVLMTREAAIELRDLLNEIE